MCRDESGYWLDIGSVHGMMSMKALLSACLSFTTALQSAVTIKQIPKIGSLGSLFITAKGTCSSQTRLGKVFCSDATEYRFNKHLKPFFSWHVRYDMHAPGTDIGISENHATPGNTLQPISKLRSADYLFQYGMQASCPNLWMIANFISRFPLSSVAWHSGVPVT